MQEKSEEVMMIEVRLEGCMCEPCSDIPKLGERNI